MLRAVNPERNVNRSWVCRIERDLFGACVVSVTFGRAGRWVERSGGWYRMTPRPIDFWRVRWPAAGGR